MKPILLFFKRRMPVIAACVLSFTLLVSAYWLRRAKFESRLNLSFSSSERAPDDAVSVSPSLTPPSSGEILMDYYGDCLVFNPTTRIYETHTGVDFACPDGNVAASADGVAKRIYTDARLGLTLEIEHENGDVTRYASLSKVLVREKSRVAAGETIALSGTSALFETGIGAHVHFEYIKNGNIHQIPFTERVKP